jgi:hypothetical protein
MAATNYTPISLYYSTTASAVPVNTNLVSGELAINITDGKLFYKDNGGVVQTLATKAGVIPSPFTANGVVYASSTSALTTGSALTFDGTNFEVDSGVTFSRAIVLSSDAGGNAFVTAQGANGIDYNTDLVFRSRSVNLVGSFIWQSGLAGSYSEQMRLTSTGLGIGTSSPGAKLHSEVSGSTAQLRLTQSSYASYNFKVTTGSALTIDKDGSVFTTLDSSGNLGLGVTPSAWGTASSRRAIELPGGGSIWGQNFGGSNPSMQVYSNAYESSTGPKYTNSSQASGYQQNAGIHAWFTAPSGTAGNAITFTQAMTLDASGNLGIGTSSPVSALTLANAKGLTWLNASGSFSSTAGSQIVKGNDNNLYIDGYDGATVFRGASFAERMRLDTSGNLLVGTTATVGSARATNSFLSSSGGTGLSLIDSQANNTARFVGFYSNATLIGSITNNGNTAVLYNVTSDQRLKENIVDAPEFGSVIDAIQVRSYDWKSDGNHQRAGFVAQELVTVAPEAVHQPADPDEMMAVDYSKLVPMLVKEIQSLRIRIAQLEAK